MAKIKVLMLTGAMTMGGLQNQLMHLMRNADKEKFQIDFTTTVEHPYYEPEILALGGRSIYLQGTDGIHFLRYCRELFAILKEGQYDIVHSHELFHSGMVLLTARLAGVKCRFVHAHSCNQDYGRDVVRHIYNAIMRRLILRNATCFLACSSVAAEFLYGKRILKNPKYHLVVNSVDTSQFLAEGDAGASIAFFDDSWSNVLQVGRFCDVKNFLFTAEIARELKRRGEKIRILCVGNDGNDYERQVREQMETYELHEYMLLLGVQKEIAGIMRRADAFLQPSKFEGMPLTMIEAQASCLPCVAADTFSHEVDFDLGAVQWLPLEAGASAWADAIERAIRQGKTNRESVKEVIAKKGFDSKRFAEIVCDLYEAEYKKVHQ